MRQDVVYGRDLTGNLTTAQRETEYVKNIPATGPGSQAKPFKPALFHQFLHRSLDLLIMAR
jgi:hypothetical protein